MDSGIEFVVINSDSNDNEQQYTINLTKEEQDVIYACLDEQCRSHLGKGCAELLAEARIQIEEDER